MNTTPFSLRIFVADGDPDGLRIVDKSNWIGKALVFPRALLPQVKDRSERRGSGCMSSRTHASGFTGTSVRKVDVEAL
jgi:hypothetical protein